MLVLNKKAKIISAVLLFVLIAAAGTAAEHFEKDAFIAETVTTDDNAVYTSESQEELNGKININSASSTELQKLKGIGEAMAERIIQYRSENGPFETCEELMKVSGIGSKKYEALKDDICAE